MSVTFPDCLEASFHRWERGEWHKSTGLLWGLVGIVSFKCLVIGTWSVLSKRTFISTPLKRYAKSANSNRNTFCQLMEQVAKWMWTLWPALGEDSKSSFHCDRSLPQCLRGPQKKPCNPPVMAFWFLRFLSMRGLFVNLVSRYGKKSWILREETTSPSGGIILREKGATRYRVVTLKNIQRLFVIQIWLGVLCFI